MSIDELKQQGNKAFSAGEYPKAIDIFTKVVFHKYPTENNVDGA